MLFEFAEFELDLERYELRRAGRPVRLQPKVFDLLSYLVQHRGRIVGREELLLALWRGEHVNKTAVPWAMSRARKALGQDQQAKSPIETVRGRGYRFVEDVRQRSIPVREPEIAAPVEVPPPAANDPFVGRDSETTRLFAALDRARRGRGSLCLVSGESGAGKTRLAREFLERVKGTGVTVWKGRCLEGGRTTPFFPWVQVLREASREPALRQQASSLVDELVPASLDSDAGPGPSRYWLVEKICRCLVEAAAETPRLVVLDDLHWADDASLDLAALLSAELPETKLLLVVLVDESVASPSGMARSSVRIDPTERIDLPPLGVTEVETYATAVLGRELPRDVAHLVHARSGGNPLFLQETLRLLVTRQAGASPDADCVRVPSSARELLRARLEGLHPDVCDALEAASVIGDEFQLGVLRHVTASRQTDLVAGLETAIGARLLVPGAEPGSYRFAHEAFRHAMYEQIPNARRLELHARTADAIQAEGDASVLSPRDFAYHLYRALPHGDPAKVLASCVTAAESAMQRFAYEEAADLYEWALQALAVREAASHRQRCDLLVSLGHALRRSGRIDGARERISEAVALARAHGMPDLLLRAARCLRARISQNSVPDPLLLSAVEEALRLAPEDDVGLRAGVLAQLACIPPHSFDVARSQQMSREAELLARRTNDPKILLDALLSRVGTLSGPSDAGTLLDVCWEVLHGYLSPSDLDRAEVNLALFYAFSLKMLRERRDYCVSEIGRLARRLRQEDRAWAFRRLTATIAFNEGRFEEARAAFEELSVDARKLRLPYGDLHRTAYLIEWARARTGLHRVIDIGPQGVSEWHWAAFQPAYQAYRASVLFGAGFAAEAKVVFDQLAASNFDEVPRELSMLCAFACLGETAIGFGDAPRAETLYGLLLPFDGYGTVNRLGFHRGPVSLHLGQLADFLGRSEAAVRHLECAVASSSQMGWVPDVVRSQVALARALDRASQAKSRRAKKLLAEARATALRLEMQPVLAEIDRLRLGEGRNGGGLRNASAY